LYNNSRNSKGSDKLHILLDYENGVPIYEQIKEQIKEQILNGTLQPNQPLPSIRTLAKELKVGIITAKRAYDDLTSDGLTYSMQGKGVYVGTVAREKITKINCDEIENQLKKAVELSKANGISREQLIEMLNNFYDEVQK
jgi:GntR family transcriptional regulator